MKEQQVDEKIGELRELIREGNGLLKDFKAVRREIAELAEEVRKHVSTTTEKMQKELGEHLTNEVNDAVQKVHDHFWKLTYGFLEQTMANDGVKQCPTVQDMFNAVTTLYNYAAANGEDMGKAQLVIKDLGPTAKSGGLRRVDVERKL